MGDRLLNSLTETTQDLGAMVTQFLPHLLAMVVIIVVGGIVAWILKVIVRRILGWVKFNQLCETAGFTQLLAKTALPSPTELLSRLVFWVVWVAFMLVGLNALGISALQQEIARFFFFLPQIFVALIILIVGVLIANFFGRATLLAAVNTNSPSPRLLSSVVRFLIIILAVTMALERIGLGHGVVLVAFAIAFGAVMFGLALAFGLGGRDAARRLLERHVLEDHVKDDDDNEISHL
ncbi:MAG: mechanosensitive ion channel family protein [Terriglobia bacterium]